MKKLYSILIITLMVFGLATSANALSYGIGYSAVDTGSYFVKSKNATYNSNRGVFTAGGALAFDDNEFDANGYYNNVMYGWADAYTSNSFAAAGTFGSFTGSTAGAYAGDGYTEEAGAVAGTFAAAYGLFMKERSEVTFSIDYILGAEIYSDTPDGYAAAGAAALLGIYQDTRIDGDLALVDLIGSYMYDEHEEGVLSFTTWLDPGMYTVFAGTASWAYANDPGGHAPVPEPATMMLLGTGLIGIAGIGRKKLQKSS